MALDCCTYQSIGIVDECTPYLNFGIANALQAVKVLVQYNGVVQNQILTVLDANGGFALQQQLFSNSLYRVALYDALGNKIGCYKFST